MEDGISVLIVEDEEIWIQNLKLLLDDFGYSVAKTASSADEALFALNNCEYDVILMDINLNGKNTGIELGKIINKLYKKPFIFITANHDKHSLEEAASAYPSAYLTKPIDPSSLFIAIQNAINNFSNNTPASADNTEGSFSSFFIKQGNKYKKIDWRDVVYLSAGKNYISVFNSLDKTEYYLRSSLQKTMQQIIPAHLRRQFAQINRAEVVQIPFITEVMADSVSTLFKSFQLSDTFSKDVRNRLKIVS